MIDCPADPRFEFYVIGALLPAEAAELEAHVRSCAACAERLEREARLETVLYEVGRSIAAERPSDRVVVDPGPHRALRHRTAMALRRPAVLGAMGVLGAAAAVAILLMARSGAGPGAGPQLAGEVRRPQLVTPVSDEAPRPGADGAADGRWVAGCPDPASLRECLAAARRGGPFVLQGPSAEDFPRYEVLTGRPVVANAAAWQR